MVTRFGHAHVRGAAQMVESDSLIQNKVHLALYAKDSLFTPSSSTPSSLCELQHEILSCPRSPRFHRDLSRDPFLLFLQFSQNSYHKIQDKFLTNYKINSLHYYLSSSQIHYIMKPKQRVKFTRLNHLLHQRHTYKA